MKNRLTLFLALFTAWLGFSSAAEAKFATNEEFAKAMVLAEGDVPEMAALEELGRKLNVKVHLFGGTAASFARFVWMKEDAKDHPGRYLDKKLEPNFENIFSTTKDIDIVIDGPPSAIQEITLEMEKRFPRSLPDGKKSAWEFRPLRYSLGPKAALLNDADFMAQHNDSLSTSLIQIVDNKDLQLTNLLEPVGQKPDALLESLRTRKISYIFSPKHTQTPRFVSGMNPPILSVIRALTKAFEYGLAITPEDEARFRQIIAEFRPSQLQGYPRKWVEQNGVKLVQNSADIERSFRVLKDLGLWNALSQIGSLNQPGDLAWWLHKQPLANYPLGDQGKTAKEIGLTTVAHATSDYRAFQVMSQSPTGKPNVFISRNLPGEVAFHGEGFYVTKGDRGWVKRNDNYSLVYDVDPEARLGTDFVASGGEDGQEFFRILNERAIRRRATKSNLPLRAKIMVMAKIEEAGSELPPVEFFESQKGQIINEYISAPPAERLAIERDILKKFSGNPYYIIEFLKSSGGLTPEGKSILADILIADAAKGNIYANNEDAIPDFVRDAPLSAEQKKKVTDIIVSREKVGWRNKVFPLIPSLDEEQKREVTKYLDTNFLEKGIAMDPEDFGVKSPGPYGVVETAPYIQFDEDKLVAYEARLWEIAKKSESNMNSWADFVLHAKSQELKKVLLKRIPGFAEEFSGKIFPHRLSYLLFKEGSTEVKVAAVDMLQKEIAAANKEGRLPDHNLLEKAFDLEAEGKINLGLSAEDRYRLIPMLHRFEGKQITQGWGTQPGGYVYPKSLYAKIGESIEHLNPSLKERREGAKVFQEWLDFIDPQLNPGLSTGRAFLETFKALPVEEQAPYRDWATRLVEALKEKRNKHLGFNRFEGDYSSPALIGELISESKVTANSSPQSVLNRLGVDQVNFAYDANQQNYVLVPDPSVDDFLDTVAANEGADGLVNFLKATEGKWKSTKNPDGFALSFVDRILLSPEWADRPDLLLEFIDQAYRGGPREGPQAVLTPKIKNLLRQPHWRDNEKLKQLVGGEPTFEKIYAWLEQNEPASCHKFFADMK